MATEKWIAGSGVGYTWTDAFTSANLNSLPATKALVGNIIDNTVAQDIFAALSIHLGSAAFVAPNYVGVGIYPLNAGAPGTVYGDGRFGSFAVGPIPGQYLIGAIPLVVATQAQDGILWGIAIPPLKFKFVLYNPLASLDWASSGNTCQYVTYNRSIA